MPAVDLVRLRSQITELVSLINDPNSFLQKFHDLLELYNSWTLKSGQDIPSKPLTKSYKVPQQIIKQIEYKLADQIKTTPQVTLDLTDALWQDETLESKNLAAYILGQMPLEYSDQVKERILTWSETRLTTAALDTLFQRATSKLEQEKPGEWQELVLGFLNHYDPAMQILGLKAIANVIENPTFGNIPSLFKIIRPFLQEPSDITQNALNKVIKALANRTPIETAYMLKQVLADNPSKTVSQNIRRYVPYFQIAEQKNLLDLIRKSSNS